MSVPRVVWFPISCVSCPFDFSATSGGSNSKQNFSGRQRAREGLQTIADFGFRPLLIRTESNETNKKYAEFNSLQIPISWYRSKNQAISQ